MIFISHRVDEDAILLKNRIALLKIEEERARKKIKETAKRTKNILDIKRQKEELLYSKNHRHAQEEHNILMQKKRNKSRKEKREQNKRELQANIFQRNKHVAVKQKAKRVQHLEEKYEFKQMIVEENRKKRQAIVHEHKKQARKKSIIEKRKVHHGKIGYAVRIEEQESKRVDREREVARLEKIEMELIQKLQNTQQKQKDAFDGLNKALAKEIDRPSPERVQEDSDEQLSGGD